MFGMSGKTIADHIATVWGAGPVAPSSTTPDYVSLKDVAAIEVVIYGINTTGVTGSAITLLQASAVAGTGEKALAFDTYYANADTGASAAFTKTTANSNTFTTTNTNSKTFCYRIPVDPATLDINGGFDCLRAGTANATNTTLCVFYNIVPKYGGNAANMPAFITD